MFYIKFEWPHLLEESEVGLFDSDLLCELPLVCNDALFEDGAVTIFFEEVTPDTLQSARESIEMVRESAQENFIPLKEKFSPEFAFLLR